MSYAFCAVRHGLKAHSAQRMAHSTNRDVASRKCYGACGTPEEVLKKKLHAEQFVQ